MSEDTPPRKKRIVTSPRPDHSALAPRRQYRKPRLVEFGDVRSLTLGGSPGVGDSGPDGFDPLGFPGAPVPPLDYG